MEAYSYAKFCKINKLNFICFKFISDNADDDAGKDWSKAFKKGAKEFSLFFHNNI
jgi:adenosylhomocysteine nucleosidase